MGVQVEPFSAAQKSGKDGTVLDGIAAALQEKLAKNGWPASKDDTSVGQSRLILQLAEVLGLGTEEDTWQPISI